MAPASLYTNVPLVQDNESPPIRILTLQHGSFDDDLVIRLHAANLSRTDSPVFEALSYVWGLPPKDSTYQVSIMTNDSDDIYPLELTENLDIALRHLRYPDKHRILWIDAICIDQKNLEERSSQVANMALVYELASRVVVWLGPEAQDSNLAIEIVGNLSSKVTVNHVRYCLAPGKRLGLDELHWIQPNCLLPYSERELCAIENLMKRPWFSRLWVIQEAQFAKYHPVVICGHESVGWRSLIDAWFLFCIKGARRRVLLGDGLERHYEIRNLRVLDDHKRRPIIPEVLHIASTLECTDPRDRVYALVPLTGWSLRELGFTPDYSASVLSEYRKFVLRCLEFFGSLNIITATGGSNMGSDANTMWPSWVPALHEPPRTKFMMPLRASGDFASDWKYQGEDEDILRVAGISCATVNTSKTLDMPGEDFYAAAIQAFAETLACSGDVEFDPPETGYWSPGQMESWMAQLLKVSKGDVLRPGDELGIKRYVESLYENTRGRAFVTTEEGYFALAPEQTQPGDIICVLFGHHDTVVLRKIENGRYRVVGECFCFGLVFGEAIYGRLPDVWVRVTEYDYSPSTYRLVYRNRNTGESSPNDPRLEGKNIRWIVCGKGDGEVRIMVVEREELAKIGVTVQDFDLV
ncbi:heterokaryon incompatibility protein-domain-containing protein [Cladorrhinum sp. PSN332]|nr:heterokaryon incompatibility protein-domain-containing protein [Cladorrhinum sp. PSN332]